MARLRFAIVFVLLLTLAAANVRMLHGEPAPVAAAPALQATAAPLDSTAATPITPPTAAPIGEGTQQVLTILGLVIAAGVLIGGGIYLRRRWIATRY